MDRGVWKWRHPNSINDVHTKGRREGCVDISPKCGQGGGVKKFITFADVINELPFSKLLETDNRNFMLV